MSVSALELWHRRPSRVQALELTHPRDLHCAEVWLRAHHAEVVRMHPALLAVDALKFRQWPSRQWTTAVLGQRLVRDVKTGGFHVLQDGEFRATHQQTTDEGEAS